MSKLQLRPPDQNTKQTPLLENLIFCALTILNAFKIYFFSVFFIAYLFDFSYYVCAK